MAARSLIAEERIGLAVALAAHLALVALILWRPPSAPAIPPPERVTVTLSEEAALTSTSPEPMAEPAPAAAPELGEPSEPAPEVQPPPPGPVPLPKAHPEPRSLPAPRPSPRAAPSPLPQPRPSPRAAPSAAPQPRARPRPAPSASARPSNRPGGSRIGANFLPPNPAAQASGASRNPPAAASGPAVQSALVSAISRELRPHWQGKVPQGVDAEKLVTVLAWSLDADGSLIGAPRVLRQEGITEANRAQASRHAEQAVRAVQLAAPFDLPGQYYDGWKRISSFRFDKRLAQ
jgi:outer membrane biosynthesis protein TonB